MVGDVEYETAKEKVQLITPVPGGVGPMTVACLLDNVVIAAKRHYKANNETPKFTNPLKLDLKKPVPSDFEISRAQQPKRITQVAEEAGILDAELEPFGFTKAKVSLDILKRLQNKRMVNTFLLLGLHQPHWVKVNQPQQ